MNHFNPKTLTFYAVAIGSVVLLFNRVTAYGETNLKAPANIEGLYPIRTQNSLGCLKTNSPVLKINQSGVYLTGSLLVESGKGQPSAEEKPALTGQWQDGKLSLSGRVPHTACPPDAKIEINGSMNKTLLSGQLSLNSSSPVPFTAQREVSNQTGQEAAH